MIDSWASSIFAKHLSTLKVIVIDDQLTYFEAALLYIVTTGHLQFYSAKLPGHCVIIQADSKLTDRFVAPMTELLAFFLLVEHSKLSITCLL